MSTAPKSPSPFARPLLALFSAGTAVGLTDRELLQRFASRRDESAELAFSVLVERHGVMVLRVCRGVLGNLQEAEDAFQATFIILARKATTVRVADTLAPWLHGVAHKVSARALASTRRRRRFLERLAGWSKRSADDRPADDAAGLIREELSRLPSRYQAAVRLCDLDGFSQEEAAGLLSLPLGTIKSRLFRGRSKLREALVRRGFSASLGWSVPQGLSSSLALPPQLATLAVRAALLEIQGGAAVGGVVASSVLALTEGTIPTMFMTKIKIAVCLAVGAGVVGGGSLASTPTNAALGASTQEPETKSPTIPSDGAFKAEIKTKVIDGLVKQGLLDRADPTKTGADADAPSAKVSSNVERPGAPKLQPSKAEQAEIAKIYMEGMEKVVALQIARHTMKNANELLSLLNAGGGGDSVQFDLIVKKLGDLARQCNLLEAEVSLYNVLLSQANGQKLPDMSVERREVTPLKPDDPGLKHEIAVQETRVAAKQGSLVRAKGQMNVALSAIAINERLNKRIQGSVSFEEIEKVKAELPVASGGVQIAEAELHEAELELSRLRSFVDHPELRPVSNSPVDSNSQNLAIERRFTTIETKLDQLLERLGPKAPVNGTNASKP